MEPLKKHVGLVAALNRVNVDTDQIVPKQFLKRIERTGFGQFLFYDWRYIENDKPNPEFELNNPEFEGATILVAGDNFGCGSSREHAPWALLDYGFKVLIAPSFADIFYNNCFKNGILPIKLSQATVDGLFERIAKNPGYHLTVDLESQMISDEMGVELSFDVDPFRKESLLNGLDDIGITLQHEDEIRAYESRQAAQVS